MLLHLNMKSLSPALGEALPASCLQAGKWWGWKHSGLKTLTSLSRPRKFIRLLIKASEPSNAKHLGKRLSQGAGWMLASLLCHLSGLDLWTQSPRALSDPARPGDLIPWCPCPFCPWFNPLSPAAQRCSIIATLPVVFPPLEGIFSWFRLLGGKHRGWLT